MQALTVSAAVRNEAASAPFSPVFIFSLLSTVCVQAQASCRRYDQLLRVVVKLIYIIIAVFVCL